MRTAEKITTETQQLQDGVTTLPGYEYRGSFSVKRKSITPAGFACHLAGMLRNSSRTPKQDQEYVHLRWGADSEVDLISFRDLAKEFNEAELPAERADIIRRSVTASQASLDFSSLGGSWKNYLQRLPGEEEPTAALARPFPGTKGARTLEAAASMQWSRRDICDENGIWPTARLAEPLARVTHAAVPVQSDSGENLGMLERKFDVARLTVFVAARDLARDMTIDEEARLLGGNFSLLTDEAAKLMTGYVSEGIKGQVSPDNLAPAASSLIVQRSARFVE